VVPPPVPPRPEGGSLMDYMMQRRSSAERVLASSPRALLTLGLLDESDLDSQAECQSGPFVKMPARISEEKESDLESQGRMSKTPRPIPPLIASDTKYLREGGDGTGSYRYSKSLLKHMPESESDSKSGNLTETITDLSERSVVFANEEKKDEPAVVYKITNGKLGSWLGDRFEGIVAKIKYINATNTVCRYIWQDQTRSLKGSIQPIKTDVQDICRLAVLARSAGVPGLEDWEPRDSLEDSEIDLAEPLMAKDAEEVFAAVGRLSQLRRQNAQRRYGIFRRPPRPVYKHRRTHAQSFCLGSPKDDQNRKSVESKTSGSPRRSSAVVPVLSVPPLRPKGGENAGKGAASRRTKSIAELFNDVPETPSTPRQSSLSATLSTNSKINSGSKGWERLRIRFKTNKPKTAKDLRRRINAEAMWKHDSSPDSSNPSLLSPNPSGVGEKTPKLFEIVKKIAGGARLRLKKLGWGSTRQTSPSLTMWPPSPRPLEGTGRKRGSSQGSDTSVGGAGPGDVDFFQKWIQVQEIRRLSQTVRGPLLPPLPSAHPLLDGRVFGGGDTSPRRPSPRGTGIEKHPLVEGIRLYPMYLRLLRLETLDKPMDCYVKIKACVAVKSKQRHILRHLESNIKQGVVQVSEDVKWPVRQQATMPTWNCTRRLLVPELSPEFKMGMRTLLFLQVFSRSKTNLIKDYEVGRVSVPLSRIKEGKDTFIHLSLKLSKQQSTLEGAPTDCGVWMRWIKPPPRHKTVFFVRHGESVWNEAQRDYDLRTMLRHTDHGLNQTGLMQALALQHKIKLASDADSVMKMKMVAPTVRHSKFLSAFLNSESLFSSPLTRALQTAIVALAHHPHATRCKNPNVLTLLAAAREKRNLGGRDSQGQATGQEIIRRARAELERLFEGTPRGVIPSEIKKIGVNVNDCTSVWWNTSPESSEKFQQRLDDLAMNIGYMPQTSVILTSHSHLIRAFFKRFCGREAETSQPALCENLKQFLVCNGGVLALDVEFSSAGIPDIKDVCLLFESKLIIKKKTRSPTPTRTTTRRVDKHSSKDINQRTGSAVAGVGKVEVKALARGDEKLSDTLIGRSKTHHGFSRDPSAKSDLSDL